MNAARFLSAAALVAALAGMASAQIKYVAVVETEVDAQSKAAAKLNKAEVREITAVLRNEARNILPPDKYKIMTAETVIAQGSAKLEECAEENCVIALGSRIGADFIIRGTISTFGAKLTLSIVIYETEDGTLVGSARVSSEKADDLLEKTVAACGEMYRKFENPQSATQKTTTPQPPVTYNAPSIAPPPSPQPKTTPTYQPPAPAPAPAPQSALKEMQERAKTSSDPQYLQLYGDALIAQGNMKEAEAVLDRILAKDPGSPNALMLRAKILRSRKKYDEALELYKEVSDILPDYAPAYYERAETYVQASKPTWAETFYNRALKADPKFALAELGLAKLYKARKQMDLYKKHLDAAQKLAPDNDLVIEEVKMAQPPAPAPPSAPAYQQQATLDGSGALIDGRDGKRYKTVVIKGKRWMGENLNYQPQSGNSWCYDNNSSNCNQYGRLYDWHTARTVCPSGWHLPSRQEWLDLLTAADGNKAGKNLKAKSGWSNNGNGTDARGFSALPGGRYDGSSFDGVGDGGLWWTAKEFSNGAAYYRGIHYDGDFVLELSYGKSAGLSVRCVSD